MALVGYSPWNDAASFGSGLGNSIANILFKLPMMRREVELENRRLALDERRINAQEARDAIHSRLYQAQLDAIPVEQQMERDKFGLEQAKVGRQTLSDAFNAWNNYRGTSSLIGARKAQSRRDLAATALSQDELAHAPEKRALEARKAGLDAQKTAAGIYIDAENARSARSAAQTGVERVNIDLRRYADPGVTPKLLDVPPSVNIDTPKDGLQEVYDQVRQLMTSPLAPHASQIVPQSQQFGDFMQSDSPASMNTPRVRSNRVYPPSPEMNIRFRNRRTGKEGWADRQSIQADPDLEELFEFEG